MSTLPPEQQVSRDVPVVTADGATAAAYKDPNSPESIMRRAKTAEAQAAVDSKYDNSSSPYEGFKGGFNWPRGGGGISSLTPIQLFLAFVGGILISIYKSSKKRSVRTTCILFGILVIILYIFYSKKNGSV